MSTSGSYNAQHTSNNNASRWTHITSVARGSISLIDLTNWSEVSRAAATAEERRELLLDVQETVLLSVAQTYYTVLRAERSVAVLKDSLVLRAEQVRDIQRGAGMLRRWIWAQRVGAVAGAVAELQALSDVRNARATLAFLIGLPAVDGPLPDQFVAPEENRSDEELETLARQYREDFLAAHFAVVAAGHSVDMPVGRWYPSLSLSLNDLIFGHPDAGVSYGLGSRAGADLLGGADPRGCADGVVALRAVGAVGDAALAQIHEQIAIAAENLRASRDQVAELKIRWMPAMAADLAEGAVPGGEGDEPGPAGGENSLLNASCNCGARSTTSRCSTWTWCARWGSSGWTRRRGCRRSRARRTRRRCRRRRGRAVSGIKGREGAACRGGSRGHPSG